MSVDGKQKFDLIVIGSGPGGYPAAIYAAQHDKKVALIEAGEIGGTCLNRGCIPSKALIAGAEQWKAVQHAKEFGIQIDKASFDYSAMVQRSQKIVTEIRTSLEKLILANQIEIFRGHGVLASKNTVRVKGDKTSLLEADAIILATGSEPRLLPQFPFDGKYIVDSTSLLKRETLPKSIAIIGAGVIGCEFASLFSLLGVPVTLLELLPQILPAEDPDLSLELTNALKKRGVAIHCNAQVTQIEKTGSGVKIHQQKGSPLEAELALIAVGRSLNTDNLKLSSVGVAVNQQGLIVIDEEMQTTVPGIYAVGDIASKWWLAHVATHQGIVAASNICGLPKKMRYEAIPSVTFTDPEIASVGLTLEAAKAKGYDAGIGAFPFQALGKSRASGHTEGFAKVVIDRATGQILGAQVAAHDASTLIAEMVLAIENEIPIECVAETIHAHPTTSEAWLEAAMAGIFMPLHLFPTHRKG